MKAEDYEIAVGNNLRAAYESMMAAKKNFQAMCKAYANEGYPVNAGIVFEFDEMFDDIRDQLEKTEIAGGMEMWGTASGKEA